MAKRRRPLFYGWWIVHAGLVTSIYTSGTFFYGFTSLFNPIVREFGWSRAATSLAFTLQRGESGAAAPVVGYLADRFGPRILVVTGAIVAGLGFILMSYVQGLLAFYATFLLAAVGLSASSPLVFYISLASWFRRKRGRAFAALAVGSALAGLLIPAIVWGVDTYGWRPTLRGIGVGTWLVVAPMALVLRHKPEPYGYLPDGEAPPQDGPGGTRGGLPRTAPEAELTLRQTLGTRAFWVLGLAFMLWMFVHSSIMVHVMPALTAAGLERAVAGLVVAGVPLLSLVGRVGLGVLADFVDKRWVLVVCLALMSVGTLIFAYTTTVWQAFLFALTYGTGFGGYIPVKSALQADYFGARSFGTVQGGFQALAMVGGMVGPVFAGWVFDVTESYQVSLLVFAAATALAVPLVVAARRPRPAKSESRQ